MSKNRKQGDSPKKRKRLLRLIGLLVGFCAVGLLIAALTLPSRRLDSGPLMERLLAAGPNTTPFSNVMSDLGWDTVCYLTPYDKPSHMLSLLLNKDLTGFDFEPYDQIMAEAENGLALIDHRKRTVRVYALNMLEQRGPAIRRITGPRCLNKTTASFQVERVDAQNISYNRLMFVSTDFALLMKRLLETGSNATSFTAVLPRPEWDTVCYIGPRNRSSKGLTTLLTEDLTSFHFEPYDIVTEDDENGLAFIDHRSRTVLVFPLHLSEKQGQSAKKEVIGPHCLKREAASFRIENVDAPNGGYHRLVFLRTE